MTEFDAMKAQLAESKAVMLKAMGVIDKLNNPTATVDPVDVSKETADMKFVTDALRLKVDAHTEPTSTPAA